VISREHTTMAFGAIVIVFASVILNLVLNMNIVLSLVIGVILGAAVGLLIGKLTGKTILGIIAWGLIVFAILSFILKSIGVISSPPITEILLGGMLIELLRIETNFKEFSVKLNMLWNDFRKRKEI